MRLNDLQIRHFHDTGYLRVPGVLDPAACEEFIAFIKTETARENPPHGKLYRLLERAPAPLAQRVLCNRVLLDALTSLLGPNVVCVTNRHNHAALGRPGQAEFRFHRDVLQPTRGLLTAVLYLRDASLGNGCTHLIPGSHRLPTVGVPQPDGGGTWMDQHDTYQGFADQALPVPVHGGDALLFDALCFHSPGRNHSPRDRPTVTLGFRSADELDRRTDPADQIFVIGTSLYRGNH